MDDFKKKILENSIDEKHDIDPNQFLSQLHNRISNVEERIRVVKVSVLMIVAVIFLTISQFGVPSDEFEYYFVDQEGTFFETDFWTINSDSLDHDSSYTYGIAYFLLQEGYIWDTVELLDELELEEEIVL